MEKIKVCPECSGAGSRTESEIYEENYHKGHFYHDVEKVCERCNGSGRILVTTTEIPYKRG